MENKSVFSLYKRFFERRPFMLVSAVVIYFFFIALYLSRWPLIEWFRAPYEVRELRMRVFDLEMQRRKQDEMINTLTARMTQADFLKPLKFDEEWHDEKAKETVGRLIEYAEFAIGKNDFERAERFYREANEVQATITIPYYEGRLAYRRGDFQRAEAKWLEAIKRDSEGKYPDLRLYLGILYYQMGRVGEAKQYLRAFGREPSS